MRSVLLVAFVHLLIFAILLLEQDKAPKEAHLKQTCIA